MPLNDFAGVRLVLLDPCVVLRPDVLMHVEVEQRPRLPPRLQSDSPLKIWGQQGIRARVGRSGDCRQGQIERQAGGQGQDQGQGQDSWSGVLSWLGC